MSQKNWMSEQEYKQVVKKTPVPCVDLVILRGEIDHLEILLIIRKTGYEKGKFCIIGGRQRIGETMQDTINRQASELGITVKIIPPFSSQFPALFNSRLNQDRTKQSTGAVYPVYIDDGVLRESEEEYEKLQWVKESELPPIMGFDHLYEVKYVIKQLKKFSKQMVPNYER